MSKPPKVTETNIETKKNPSMDEAQARASDPRASVWVSANAGSGKTHALTTRVARLLLSGTSPERILCLTFTKAAAAEMSTRLYARLGGWTMMSDEKLAFEIASIEGPLPSAEKLGAARRLFARAIETPGGLKIQTIHAFCESLLGRFPLEAGISPNFEVLDERSAGELQREVRDHVLRRALREGGRLGGALSHIAGRIDERTFGNLLLEVTGKRGVFTRLAETYGSVDDISQAMREALSLAPEDTAVGIRAGFFTPPGFPEDALRQALATLHTSSAKTEEKVADVLARVLEVDSESRVVLLDEYLKLFLTEKDEPRKNVITVKHGNAHPQALETFLSEQQRVLAFIGRVKAAQVAESSEAIFLLANEILQGFADAKRRRAVLDYEDLISAAKDLLLKSDMAAWVLYKLDGGIDHILVDEAQDTSPDQWQIVAALAEEFMSGMGAQLQTRTIFAVGDEKQSIFSFQGADPARFDAMRSQFERKVKAAELVWDPVRLVRSFRSVPEVLRAVDLVFARDEAKRGLSASGHVDEHAPTRLTDAGLVELWDLERADSTDEADAWDAPLDYVSESDPMARLAARIAATIKTWLDNGEILPSKQRAIVPGDILILVRRRDAFVGEMIRALKALAIPVAGMDRMVLTEQIAVMDLMALGRFMLLPEDDLNLAALLKSPFAGLSEDDLFDLAWNRKGALWDALKHRSEENPQFAQAHSLLARLLGKADFLRPYEFFAQALNEEGGRRKLLARLGEEALDPIEEFLALTLDYERDHAPSLEGFLHWLETSGAEIKRDMEKGEDVRVMTVHGSKGLEAEIVFMPDTCAAPSARFDPHLIELPTEPKLLLWPVRKKDEDARAAEARLRWREAQQDEYRRLLYVAMTRARDRLYIAGYHGTRPPASGCWYELIAEALKPQAREIVDDQGRKIWRIENENYVAPSVEEQTTAPAETPLPEFARRLPPEEPAPVRPLSPSRLPPDGATEPPALSPLAPSAEMRFQRGRLIHRLLQTLPELAAQDRREAAIRFLASRAKDIGEAAKQEILETTLAIFDRPEFGPLFAVGSKAEAAIVGHIEWRGAPVLVSGQVDRLCVTPQSVMIVDYKTNRPPPVDIADVSPAYLGQMAVYREVLSRIYPDREVKCALLWTDGPRLMELPASSLDKAARLDLGGRAS